MGYKKSKYERKISELKTENYYDFLAKLQKLTWKKEAELNVGRLYELHTFITRDWELGSDQWHTRKLETLMQGKEAFKDIVELTNCHIKFSKESQAKDKEIWADQLESDKELFTEMRDFFIETGKEISLLRDSLNNSGGKQIKQIMVGGETKYIPTYTTKGLGTIYRRMHPKTAPSIREEMIKDYFKMQNEQGLPYASEHPKNKYKLNQNVLRKMFEAQGMEYLFHIYGALASVGNMKDLVEETKYVAEKKKDIEAKAKGKKVKDWGLLQYRSDLGSFYEKHKDDVILPERIIFESALRRLRTVKGITEETLYTFLLYLYKVFADDDAWVKSRGQLPDDEYWFAEELLNHAPVAQWDAYHSPMSEFLLNVEEFEETGKWKTIEHLYRDKYFPKAKID